MNSDAYVSRNPRFNDDFERGLTNDLDHQLRRGSAAPWPWRLGRHVRRLLARAFGTKRIPSRPRYR